VTIPDISKSFDLQEHAKKRIPGMTQLLSKRPDQFSYGVWPGYYSKAKGVEIWDLDDNRYIDMSIGGIGANVLGYADPDVDAAVKQAVCKGTSCSLNCPEEVELADLLCELHPWADKVRYARSGGEAMAIAVRIARAHTGRDKVAFCGYHGWHDWYLAANIGTEDALGRHLLSGLNPSGVPKGLEGTALPFQYNQLEGIQQIVHKHRGDLAAIVIEPIRNEQPKPGFLQEIRNLADESGSVFIVDEISSGFRMNTGGAHLLFQILPDIAVFSKSLGNGYPIAAIIGRGNIMEAAQNTFISSTMWTERIGPTAALATVSKHQRMDVGKYLTEIGRKVQNGWIQTAEHNKIDIDVGGIPPLSHFSFQYDNGLELKAYFIQLMIEKGFLSSTLFYAMYAHQNHQIEKYIKAVDECFREIKNTIQRGGIREKLKGLPAASGFRRLT